ncbi:MULTISPECIES: sugar ABC transporter ATP-binding protein [Rhizobium]|uniref:Ribose transport system ATP-binding protein n=1 Tax=Rhizobium tropici TaxID=398 RepID=A0A6P1C3D9_RHITR|nr:MULTISPECIES: sugar ABC transporter ATP-binding protein [Rhizobium]AGB75018.1 putative amino acid ABC trabsporter, RbsA-like ATP-binding protein [Rhizobium tropici CIAT 899]MBB4243038.1 ribose transport system ATP-binding protein [Rhizobium tropici]MBB5594547.1 ribose transport system ATP-binding protein [Rhizobium tropici]MBB6493364.1 ribose transport system ATP-binding protein [Rhizobium tropici]NEV11568.1 sugar ABC transporter ATP-binding protein [Rhizobium tropici]
MSPAAASDQVATPVLEMQNISKTFGNARALTNVSLTVYPGEVHALMGENGAGKSTLMKVLSGAYVADPGGSVLVIGRPVIAGDPIKARANGIAVIYQELSLAPNLTVAQNMFLGAEPSLIGFVDRGDIRKRAEPILKRLGIAFSPNQLVASLSLGERQMVEIARALTTNARIIVMDEPTTSLTSRETEKLFEVIAGLKAHGIAIIYISHRMEEIYALADRVSVLRDSAYVGTLERSELSAERLVSMMVGRDLSSFYKKEHRAGGRDRQVVLSVNNIGDGRRVHDCSFEACAGEVLGIAGLVGSGRTELARLIYGADHRSSGSVSLDDRDLSLKGPRAALDAGIAYLTEDRKGLGLFLDMSINENINIGVISEDSRSGGFLDFGKGKKRADSAVSSLSIRTRSTAINVGALSGGNQQKVLLARLLETKPRVIILDEPTRGVDVGAKSEIYRIIDELAESGIAIVVISSDLPEIIGIADRVLVMREGRIAGEIAGSEERPISQEAIMALSTGAAKRGA